MADVDDRWYRGTGERKTQTARYGRGKRWLARWRDETGRQRYKAFDKKVDADRFAATVKVDTARGTFVDPAAGKVTFRELAERWRAAQVHRPAMRAKVETALRVHAYPRLGDRRIGDVRPSEIQAWVRELDGTLAAGTVKVVYSYVSGVFRAAELDRLIGRSPCVGIKLPRAARKRVEPLGTDAVLSLIGAMPTRYGALVTTAAGTGLRQGEVFGVEVPHVDFLRKSLVVEQQLVLLPGAPPVVSPLKTPASYRTIPLGKVVVDALAAHLAAFPVGKSGLVFTDDDGKPLRRDAFNRVWRAAVAEAKLPKGTKFHDLRHYFASLLIRHGESVKVVQERLGHARAAETLDTYSHLWPDSEDRTRAAVDEGFKPTSTTATDAPARQGG